jgi:hypothetical protein
LKSLAIRVLGMNTLLSIYYRIYGTKRLPRRHEGCAPVAFQGRLLLN